MLETSLLSQPPHPIPSPEGEGLKDVATRLAGLAGALLGWRPDEFWRATPAELAAILDAMTPEGSPADASLIDRLKRDFPDG